MDVDVQNVIGNGKQAPSFFKLDHTENMVFATPCSGAEFKKYVSVQSKNYQITCTILKENLTCVFTLNFCGMPIINSA